MAKETTPRLRGDQLDVCNPFPGTQSACLYKKQADGSIKPVIWLNRPQKVSKEEFDAIVNNLAFRVLTVKEKSETEFEDSENQSNTSGSDSELIDQTADPADLMPAD